MNRIQEKLKDYEIAGYWGNLPIFDDIRHNHAHLSKLVGQLGEYVEMTEHFKRGELSPDEIKRLTELEKELRKKLPPDLVIFGTHFANIFNQDLDEAVDSRMRRNRARAVNRKHKDLK